MRLRRDSSLSKTAAFAVVHLAIAVTLGGLFTGTFVLGGLLAFVEPAANTLVGHQVEALVRRLRLAERRRALAQSALLAVSHLAVAVACMWWLSGSLLVATAYALVEPLANAIAWYFFDRWWERAPAGAPAAA